MGVALIQERYREMDGWCALIERSSLQTGTVLQGACSVTGCVLSYRVRAQLQGACSNTGCVLSYLYVLSYRVHAQLLYTARVSFTGE